MIYVYLALLVIATNAYSFYRGAKYGAAKMNAFLENLSADLDAQYDHLKDRINEEAREHVGLVIAYIKNKLGI